VLPRSHDALGLLNGARYALFRRGGESSSSRVLATGKRKGSYL
jgi:hypothetical protein